MKDVLELLLICGVAVLVLGLTRMVGRINESIRARGPSGGDRIPMRFRTRFPLIPTKDSEWEKNRPWVRIWALIDCLVILLILAWLFARN